MSCCQHTKTQLAPVVLTPSKKQGVRPGYPKIRKQLCCMMARLCNVWGTPACTLVCSRRHQLVMGVPVPPGSCTPAYATKASLPTPPGSMPMRVSCLPQGQCQGLHPSMFENAMPPTYLKADAPNAARVSDVAVGIVHAAGAAPPVLSGLRLRCLTYGPGRAMSWRKASPRVCVSPLGVGGGRRNNGVGGPHPRESAHPLAGVLGTGSPNCHACP